MKRNRTLVRFGLEVLIYGILVAIYLGVVLQWFVAPLTRLAKSDLGLYAVVALGLIVVQGLVLESLTSFLLDRLDL